MWKPMYNRYSYVLTLTHHNEQTQIYFANQPNSKGLVHSTFLPLNPVSRNQGTTISELIYALNFCFCVFVFLYSFYVSFLYIVQ